MALRTKNSWWFVCKQFSWADKDGKEDILVDLEEDYINWARFVWSNEQRWCG